MTTTCTDVMTFEQFQATRRYCANLGEALHDDQWAGEPNNGVGNLYGDCFYIEHTQPHWPAGMRSQGAFCLTIGNQQRITDDLVSLERELYDYAVSEDCL